MRRNVAWRVALSGVLTSLMLVLGIVERQFPLPVGIPGIKLGLANSVLLYSVYMLGAKQSIILMLLKTLLSWFIYSNMDAMVYSFCGGVLSLAVMMLAARMPGISEAGVSVLGAVFFNVGQIAAAVVKLHTPQLFFTYLPVLMVSGVVTGMLTGIIAKLVMRHLGGMMKNMG